MSKTKGQEINVPPTRYVADYASKMAVMDPIKLPSKEMIIHINYPLDKPTDFSVTFKKLTVTADEILHEAGKLYKQIYSNEEEYGIWGHAIEDLVFETIIITGNKISFGVGS